MLQLIHPIGTSKHNSSEALLGRNGTFLASLSAVSLLAITSRHHQHRSHNSVTFHHAKAIQRQLPASTHQHIDGKHGTRVTVRNLFGNLPVRVKQRAKVATDKVENDRLWDNVKTGVVALLLSCAKAVSLKARDANNHTIFTLNTTTTAPTAHTTEANVNKARSVHLPRMLNMLTQAGYITVGQWSSWVPISASTSSVSVKGTISLEPSPTKGIQFVSLGVQPVLAVDHNELFDHINRLFTLSSFGAIEDDDEDGDKFARSRTARSREDAAYTGRQLKVRKGVDRYPMFHLRISCSDEVTLLPQGGQCIEQDTDLQAVVDVLDAMIFQWLSVHHFRPLKPRTKRNGGEDSSASYPNSPTWKPLPPGFPDGTTATSAVHSSQIRAATDTMRSSPKKRRLIEGLSENSNNQAFAQWSRIKSSKASFFTDAMKLWKSEHVQTSSKMSALRPASGSFVLAHRSYPESAPVTNLQPSEQGASSVCLAEVAEVALASEHVLSTRDGLDDTVLWTDPLTKQTHTLNARTGCVVPLANPRPATDPAVPTRNVAQTYRKDSLRLLPRTATSGKTPWLDNVLQTWDNPIFDVNQQAIELSHSQDCCHEQGAQEMGLARGHVFDKHNFGKTLPANRNRLSKDDLLGCQVIAQVDKKFILIKARDPRQTNALHEKSTALLVLVDQHAADERIRVERLLEELCIPVDASCAYQSNLGHSSAIASVHLERPLRFFISPQEKVHFISHAARFASWGILFNVSDSMTTAKAESRTSEQCYLLVVIALPTSVSERCKADTDLLISFLRSTVWHYASSPTIFAQNVSGNWQERITTCPKGLLDMINSRACRSAIMFNDELDMRQCKDLVQRLASCTFPFVCAHGRPSMVPLVDISGIGNGSQTAFSTPTPEGGSFVQSWKQWQG